MRTCTQARTVVLFLSYASAHSITETSILSKASPKSRSRLLTNWRTYVVAAVFLITLAFGISEAISQHRESRYVAEMAQHIVRQANASDETSKVIALRDYLRRNVT